MTDATDSVDFLTDSVAFITESAYFSLGRMRQRSKQTPRLSTLVKVSTEITQPMLKQEDAIDE